MMGCLRFAGWAALKSFGMLLLLTAIASQAMAFPGPHNPEIDAGSIASAIAMLGFGAMMFADRVRRK